KLPAGASYTALTDYTLTLRGGASGIASDDAIQPNLFPADVQVDFTTDNTPDTTAPSITFRSPASGLTGVASNTSVVVTFSEAVNPATVTGAQFTLSSAGGPVTGTVSYDAASWTATFTPSAALGSSTVYTVSLANIQDLSGLSIAATSWSFTTGTAPDTTPPTVTAVSPANTATAVASSDPILVTFSENVDIASLTGLRLRQVADGTFVAGSVSYNATTRVATFTPSVLLGSLTTYEVNVSGARDVAGNAMASPFTSRFTTRRTLFADNFESGAGAWSLPAPTAGVPWSLTTANFHSSNHSLTDSAGGKYVSNVVSYAELAAPLSVSGLTSVSVQFWMKARTERNKDFVSVEASVDGGAWTPLTSRPYTGNLSWAVRSLNLPLSGKSTLRIRFRFESNATKNFDGVYVDDIIIQSP
ncbi:MAG TPA: Ig-like domain-containing protein, partial [Archangium sp.]|nr:Ig-like domain-containing protein [Archangium sp.]